MFACLGGCGVLWVQGRGFKGYRRSGVLSSKDIGYLIRGNLHFLGWGLHRMPRSRPFQYEQLGYRIQWRHGNYSDGGHLLQLNAIFLSLSPLPLLGFRQDVQDEGFASQWTERLASICSPSGLWIMQTRSASLFSSRLLSCSFAQVSMVAL